METNKVNSVDGDVGDVNGNWCWKVWIWRATAHDSEVDELWEMTHGNEGNEGR